MTELEPDDGSEDGEAYFEWVGFDDPAPKDIVPGAGPTREHLLRLNDSVGTWAPPPPSRIAGYGIDGWPIMVANDDVIGVWRGRSSVTASELERVGLTAADVPKLRVLQI